MLHKKCYPFIGSAAYEGGGGADPAEAFGDDRCGLLGFGFEGGSFTRASGEVVGCSGGAGAAGDDVDVVGTPFIPEGFGEGFQETFGAGVSGEEAGTLEAGEGTHDDDAAAAAFDHL